MPDINMQVFEEAKRNQLVTEVDIQTQVALDDYQVQLSNIANPTQSQDNVVIDRFGEFLSHWNESLDFDTWVKMNMEVAGKQILMLRGNSNLNSVSLIDNTMIFGDEYTGITIDISKWDETDVGSHITQNDKLIFDGGTSVWGQTGIASDNTFARPFIYQTKWRTSSTSNTRSFGIKDTGAGVSYDDFVYMFHADPSAAFKLFEDGSVKKSTDTYAANTDYWLKVEILSTGAKYYRSTDNLTWTLLYTSSYSTESPLKIGATSYQGAQEFDNTFVRKYTADEPDILINTPKNISITLKSLGRAG